MDTFKVQNTDAVKNNNELTSRDVNVTKLIIETKKFDREM